LAVLSPLLWDLFHALCVLLALTPNLVLHFVSRVHLDLLLQLALLSALFVSLGTTPTMAHLAASAPLVHPVRLVLRRVLLVKTGASLPLAPRCAPRVPPDS
jgi:hypothetical protein